jgi:predicted Zn-dependent protease
VAADICRMTAEHAAGQNHTPDAVKFYKEALTHQPNDPDTLIALAKLYLQVSYAMLKK